MKLVLATMPFFVAMNKPPTVVEWKCKIQLTGAGEDETMIVRTS
ncbi:hypothetical protein [Anabaena sp. 4-3]|nr:hypothetical protein [Anabaena sp. 4-3]